MSLGSQCSPPFLFDVLVWSPLQDPPIESILMKSRTFVRHAYKVFHKLRSDRGVAFQELDTEVAEEIAVVFVPAITVAVHAQGHLLQLQETPSGSCYSEKKWIDRFLVREGANILAVDPSDFLGFVAVNCYTIGVIVVDLSRVGGFWLILRTLFEITSSIGSFEREFEQEVAELRKQYTFFALEHFVKDCRSDDKASSKMKLSQLR
jgi:hypothetical protein